MRFTSALNLKKLQALSRKFSRLYPNELQQKTRSITVNFETQDTSFTDDEDIIRRTSKDEADIVVLRSKRVSVSRLAPYSKWSDFRNAIENALSLAFKERPARQIERVGLRYINRIDIPFQDGVAEFENYLNVYIKLPDDIPSVGPYELRFLAARNGFAVHVQSSTAEAPIPNTLAISLDIDVMKKQDTPSDLEQIMLLLDEMRDEKNSLFEAFVTDKARRLFDNA